MYCGLNANKTKNFRGNAYIIIYATWIITFTASTMWILVKSITKKSTIQGIMWKWVYSYWLLVSLKWRELHKHLLVENENRESLSNVIIMDNYFNVLWNHLIYIFYNNKLLVGLLNITFKSCIAKIHMCLKICILII